MLPFWPRFKNGVLQNLTATYFRGWFVKGAHNVTRRAFSYQDIVRPTVFPNKLYKCGICLLLVPGKGVCFTKHILNNVANFEISRKLYKIGFRESHSCAEDHKMKTMEVKILPALSDNYMFMIICNSTREAAVVDPVDAECVISTAKEACVNLTKVLTTHHHLDHSGGNEKLVKLFDKPLEVYGGDDRIGALNKKVKQDDCFTIGDLKVKCLFTPCHTTGHICFYVESPCGDKCVFTGDTLFQGGCGRFFEGTPEQMYEALIKKLGALPDDTKVFCGHEYTLQNLAYARHVEPQNENILKRIEWAKLRRATLSPTVPSTIGEEKTWNPFMRVHEPAVQKHANECDPICTMGSLRKEKDNFKA